MLCGGYNRQVIDIQTICVLTSYSSYTPLRLMVNFRCETPSLPRAENCIRTLLCEMVSNKSGLFSILDMVTVAWVLLFAKELCFGTPE